jgi:hypothetical protein
MARRSLSAFTAALAALSLMIQGCASPGAPITQTVRVETPGCPAARCELKNDRGQWQLASTPGTVTLVTSDAPLQVSCRAADGTLGLGGAAGSARPMTATGGVVGGIAGGAAAGAAFGAVALTFIPVLGVIILATGVAAGAAAGQSVEAHGRALSYPDLISIPMTCPEPGAPMAASPPAFILGLQVQGLAKAQADAAGLGDRGGALVTAVTAGGPAAAAGLRSGDIILSVGGQEVRDGAMLEELVRAAAGAPLVLKVWRDGQTLGRVLATRQAAP